MPFFGFPNTWSVSVRLSINLTVCHRSTSDNRALGDWNHQNCQKAHFALGIEVLRTKQLAKFQWHGNIRSQERHSLRRDGVHGLLSIHLNSYDFGIIEEWRECLKKILV
jgi:hypothetical protein